MRVIAAAAIVTFTLASTLAQAQPLSPWGQSLAGGTAGTATAGTPNGSASSAGSLGSANSGSPGGPACTPNLSDLAKNGSKIASLSNALTADVSKLTAAENAYNQSETQAANARAAAQSELVAASKLATGSTQWNAAMQKAVTDEAVSSILFTAAGALLSPISVDRAVEQVDEVALDTLLGCPATT